MCSYLHSFSLLLLSVYPVLYALAIATTLWDMTYNMYALQQRADCYTLPGHRGVFGGNVGVGTNWRERKKQKTSKLINNCP